MKTLPFAIALAVAAVLPARAQPEERSSACKSEILPLDIRNRISKEFPSWRIEEVSDLNALARGIWKDSAPAGDCPGIAVGQFAEDSGTNPGHTESQAEKQARDQTDFSRDQFLRVNQDGGEGGGQDDPNNDGEDAGPEEIGVRKRERERCNPKDRNPDDELATVTVSDRAAEDGAECDGKKEKEQMELRSLD